MRRCSARDLTLSYAAHQGGLEFDHALVPSATEFEGKRAGDGARHFYVAATRASRSLSVLSASAAIKFSAPVI